MRTLPLALLLAFAPIAHAQVFKCVDAEGHVTYTNTAQSKGCTALSTEQPVSSVPAPTRSPSAAPQATPGTFPRVAPETQRARDDTRRQVLEKELAREQEALTDAQKSLAEEEKRDAPEDRNIRRTGPDGRSYSSLNPAKMEMRLQPLREKVELHQRNIQALQREISGLR